MTNRHSTLRVGLWLVTLSSACSSAPPAATPPDGTDAGGIGSDAGLGSDAAAPRDGGVALRDSGSARDAGVVRGLWVNGASGDDAISKAENSETRPWRSIGRAAWGNADRTAPNAAEAAAAGDTVFVAGGTYTSDVAVGERFEPVYNPVNAGTMDAPIAFECVGVCQLGAPNANSPVIGAVGRDHIRWYADSRAGHAWRIDTYGLMAGSATPLQVNTTPDTGPVVCASTTGCWIEGTDIDGGLQTDYTDNYNAIRVDNAPYTTVRNNRIRSFRNLDDTGNGTGITLYGSPHTIIEHNFVTNAGSGVVFKDTGFTVPQNDVHVRLNHFDGVGRCVSWSMTAEDRNYVYQNVCTNSLLGLHTTGGGLSNDWIFNNTFDRITGAGVLPSGLGAGGRFWNNVVTGAHRVIVLEVSAMHSETVIDFEHNAYDGYDGFYSGTDGNRTFVSYLSTYPEHDHAAPASADGDVQYVDAAAGDYRICTGPGAPAPTCTAASVAVARGVDILDFDADGDTVEAINAGAYVTNTELVGVE